MALVSPSLQTSINSTFQFCVLGKGQNLPARLIFSTTAAISLGATVIPCTVTAPTGFVLGDITIFNGTYIRVTQGNVTALLVVDGDQLATTTSLKVDPVALALTNSTIFYSFVDSFPVIGLESANRQLQKEVNQVVLLSSKGWSNKDYSTGSWQFAGNLFFPTNNNLSKPANRVIEALLKEERIYVERILSTGDYTAGVGIVTDCSDTVSGNGFVQVSLTIQGSGRPLVVSGSAPILVYDPLAPNNNDIGFDVVLAIGQSNMVSHTPRVTGVPIDSNNLRIQQRNSINGNIQIAENPLFNPDRPNVNFVSLPVRFAHSYLTGIPVTRKILLIPQAAGGTGFGDNRWNPGNDLYEAAITATNSALALDPKNRLVGIIWHQGENDVTMAKSTYISRLDAMIDGFRARLTGGSNVKFVLGELVRGWVGTDSGRVAIQAAINETPTRKAYTAVATSENLTAHDGIHFDHASLVELGNRYASKLIAAGSNTGSQGTPPPQLPADFLTNLRFRYAFQGNFTDSSGNNYVPVNDGITIISDATRGSVANFPGNDSELVVTCGMPSEYSKVGWVRSTSNNANQNFITSNDLPDSLVWMPIFGDITFGQSGNFTLLTVPTANKLVLNTWTHIAVTFKTTTARIYVNGVKVAEKTDCPSYSGAAAPFVVKIGNYGTSDTWVGQMDDVRLYNIELTAAQVNQIFNATTA